MPKLPLHIGADRADQTPVALDLPSMLRHLMAIGSSGSGKTVLCKLVTEEMALRGVPAICIDPQGDLCSLALAAADPEALAAKGVDPALARAFAEQVDVVVFTPAARKGVPLSADPIRIDPAKLKGRERTHAFTATATMLVSLLGYDLGSDDGEGLVAVFDKSLHLLFEQERFPPNLDAFSDYWLSLEDADRTLYGRYLDGNKIDQACRKLARLDVGARRLLFHDGIPLDIDMLLGRGAGALPGKTRISVIYLNTLHSQEDKEYFVAALTQQLYTWMLDNPSQEPQALFYIDEVAPYIPPVRKPACKDGLSLLFKQARKYGVACLMATQNPADVDYKAMAQFGTWGLGRLTTRQDLKKIQPTVKALEPVRVDRIMGQLPAQKPGQFLLLSPDNFEQAREMQTRWLYSRHETLDEGRIEALADERWRARFPLPAAAAPASKPTPEPEPEPEPKRPQAPQPTPADSKLARLDGLLARAPSLSVRELAERAKLSESAARSSLGRLVKAGLARRFKQGRSHRYWSCQSGLRPDLGLVQPVKAIVPVIDRAEAERIAHDQRARKLLGFLGDDEELASAELEYRPLYRLSFEEKVKRPFWRRLFAGGAYEQRGESVYLDARSLKLVVFHPEDGLFLHAKPEQLASEIEDFDGVVRFETRPPGELAIDEHEWAERQPEAAALAHFGSLYEVRPQGIEPLFVPLWRLHLRVPGKPGTRILTVDAISGFGVDW